MDENHQDKTESKLTATEDNTTPSSLSPQDQRGTDQFQDNQMEDTIKHLSGKPGYKVIVEYDKLGYPSKFSQEIPPRKTWWDLLNLIGILLIPLVVVGATIGFGWWQVHLADLQHQQDQLRAQDQQEATILQTYIDNIQDLLLNHNLLKSKPTDDVAILARARTLTALEALPPLVYEEHSPRKGTVVQFIYEAHLIGYYNHTTKKLLSSIIDLTGANLIFADVSFANLTGADLTGADLTGANLLYANLYSADLTHVSLDGTNLNFADLSGATLHDATLTCTYLHDATLTCAYLTGAHLSSADLSGADLTGAHLTGADLTGADLTGAHLTGAHLTGADLTGAHLTGDFQVTGIRLSGATVTQQQLDQVYSCKNAILPPLLTCHHNPPA